MKALAKKPEAEQVHKFQKYLRERKKEGTVWEFFFFFF